MFYKSLEESKFNMLIFHHPLWNLTANYLLNIMILQCLVQIATLYFHNSAKKNSYHMRFIIYSDSWQTVDVRPAKQLVLLWRTLRENCKRNVNTGVFVAAQVQTIEKEVPSSLKCRPPSLKARSSVSNTNKPENETKQKQICTSILIKKGNVQRQLCNLVGNQSFWQSWKCFKQQVQRYTCSKALVCLGVYCP